MLCWGRTKRRKGVGGGGGGGGGVGVGNGCQGLPLRLIRATPVSFTVENVEN